MGSLGIPETSKEAARAWALGQARARARDPAASFIVPGDPKAVHGCPAYAYGSQVANVETLLWWASLLKSLCRYKVDMAKCYFFIGVQFEITLGTSPFLCGWANVLEAK